MRKFTKGLLMTFVASAISLGAAAQEHNGYFRVINAGANQYGYNYVQVVGETSATLKCTAEDAITRAGTVMWLNSGAPEEGYGEGTGPYMDIVDGDEQVFNLRSQGQDAEEFVYGEVRSTLRSGFEAGLKGLNGAMKWNLTPAKQTEIIDAMFKYMKMFLTPTTTSDQKEAWYLKSTTPYTMPLAEALTEAQRADLMSLEPNKPIDGLLWDMLINSAIEYFNANDLHQLATDFVQLSSRIHMGHTYYLCAGYVKLDLNDANSPQTFIYTASDPEISFCNNNTVDYPTTGLIPEVDFIGDYSKWFLEPVVENSDPDYEGTDYFAVNPSPFMEGYTDGKFYTSLYVDFPMEIVGEGVRVWGIVGQPIITDTRDGKIAIVTTQEYTDVVPARQGVVVECKYNENDGPAGNCLQPVLTPKEGPVGQTLLTGLFFDKPFDNGILTGNRYTNWQEVEKDKIRVLNKKSSAYDGTNPIGFYAFKGNYITGNKAFMILDMAAGTNVMIVSPEAYADGISEAQVATESNAVIYDLQGRQVANPVKGIYVVNGKKVVIK
jgi:hypothetical protein